MAEEVVRTFDLYNTTVLLPGYTITGYSKEFDLTRNYYSTDYSSNPIGSKVDFFTQLDDPCSSLYNPNPVFSVGTSLSSLSPLWFDQWWDEAMYYSHPLVLEQLKASNPATFQSFSDSVGTLNYVSNSATPISPALNSKLPSKVMSNMTRLNRLLNVDLKAFTPPGFGPNTTKLTSQLAQYTSAAATVKSKVNQQFSSINRKLPLNVVQKGNLITPSTWKFDTKIQGVNTAVDRLGNVIRAPGKMLSNAVNKVKSFIPVIKLPPLPSLDKLASAVMPNMPAVSNLVNAAKTAAGTVQAAVSTAQGAIGAAQATVAAAKSTIGGVQNAISSVTGTVSNLGGAVAGAGGAITNIVKSSGTSTINAMRNQSSTALSNLNSNAAIVVNKAANNKSGNSATNTVNTFDYKK